MASRSKRTFSASPKNVGRARHYAGAVARRWGFDADLTELVTSELAANAVCHSNSDFSVALARTAFGLILEVSDDDPRLPKIGEAVQDAAGGRGLLIVDRLAHAWGVRGRTERGKVVWVELDHRPKVIAFSDCA